MKGLETAIRNALARAGKADADTRDRIYRSARTAFEKGVTQQGLDAEQAEQQRRRFDAIVRTIELEYSTGATRPAASGSEGFGAPVHGTSSSHDAAEQHAPTVDGGTRSATADARHAAPEVDPGQRQSGSGRPDQAGAPHVSPDRRSSPPASSRSRQDGPRIEPVIDSPADRREPAADIPQVERPAHSASSSGGPATGRRTRRIWRGSQDESNEIAAIAASEDSQKAGRKAKRPRVLKKRRRPIFSLIFVLASLVSFGGIGLWWAQTSGILKSFEERDGSVPNPPRTFGAEDYSGGDASPRTLSPDNGFSSNWVVAYEAGGDGSVERSAAVSTEVVNDESTALRIMSARGDDTGEASILLPAELLAAMAGRPSTIAMSVRGVEPGDTQIYVRCDFSTLGDCGRRRFTVNDAVNDVIFNVSFDGGLAPTTPGKLIINSDVTGGGRAIDIFAVRIKPGT